MLLNDLVESHTHAGMIPYYGFKSMGANGITKAISCAIVIAAHHAESYFDHFRMISGFYRQLAASVGLKLYSAVGVHPAGIPSDWSRVIDRLPEFLQDESTVAIGEVGMNQASQLEKNVLRAQFEVAVQYKVPVIVHTPKENRPHVVEETLNLAQQVGLDPGLLVIDHAHLDIIGQISDFGAVPGLTIRDQNLTPQVLVENLDLFKNGMLNSDYSNIMSNDPVGMMKAVDLLMSRGVDPGLVTELAGDRAKRLYML